MAFKLNMGNKPTDPNNFSQRDQKTMNASRATFDNQSSFSHPDFQYQKPAMSYKKRGLGGNIIGTSRRGFYNPFNKKPNVLK